MAKTPTVPQDQQTILREALIKAFGIDKSEYASVQYSASTQKVILPEGMDPETGIEVLSSYIESEEADVEVDHRVYCVNPLDGAYHLAQALNERYGNIKLETKHFFFSSMPPQIISVPLAGGTTAQVPWGRMSIPGVQGRIDLYGSANNSTPYFGISGQVRKRDERLVLAIAQDVERRVRESSIYKGHATMLDLDWVDDGDFDPRSDIPAFIDTSPVDVRDVILNTAVWDQLKTALLGRVTQTHAHLKMGRPIRNGIILHGEPGTGKTHFLRYLARVCEDHGWSYLHVKSPEQITDGLRIARLLQPAVLVAEDIDQMLSRDRDDIMNQFLNEIDGVVAKGDQLAVVVTTNAIETINRTALRAGGRLGSHIHFGAVDQEAAAEFILRFAGDYLADPENVLQPAKAMAEARLVPAFAHQAILNSQELLIYEHGADINGRLTCDHITRAVLALDNQLRFMETEADIKKINPLEALSSEISTAVVQELRKVLKPCALK